MITKCLTNLKTDLAWILVLDQYSSNELKRKGFKISQFWKFKFIVLISTGDHSKNYSKDTLERALFFINTAEKEVKLSRNSQHQRLHLFYYLERNAKIYRLTLSC